MQRPLAMKAAAAESSVGVRRCAQLDLLSAHFMRCLYLFGIRIDKETCKYSGLPQTRDSGAHNRHVSDYIETAFGRYFVRILRNERNRVRLHLERDL